jgi:hypothetical protein
MKTESKKPRLRLAKETIASMRIKTGINTGMQPGGGGGGLISLPVKGCISNVVKCPDPPPPKPTTSALCF